MTDDRLFSQELQTQLFAQAKGAHVAGKSSAKEKRKYHDADENVDAAIMLLNFQQNIYLPLARCLIYTISFS